MSINVYDMLSIVGKKISGISCKQDVAGGSNVIVLFLMFDDGSHFELHLDAANKPIINEIDMDTILEGYLDSNGRTVIVKG